MARIQRSSEPHSRLMPRDLFAGLVMAATGAWWLSWLHPAQPQAYGALVDALIALPFALPLVLATLPSSVVRLRRAVELSENIPVAVLRCAALVALAVSAGNQLRSLVVDHASLQA